MLLPRSRLTLFEYYPAKRRMGARLRAVTPSEPAPKQKTPAAPAPAPAPAPARQDHNPYDHPPWHAKGKITLTPKEQMTHLKVLSTNIGRAHPSRRGEKITGDHHRHAADALMRHHQSSVIGAAHNHYQHYRGRAAKPHQISDAFGSLSSGLVSSQDPSQSGEHMRVLAKRFLKQREAGRAHHDDPQFFGAYIGKSVHNKLKSVRIKKAVDRKRTYAAQQELHRAHEPPRSAESGRLSDTEKGSDTDARRSAIHDRIAHHINRLEKKDPDDEEATTAYKKALGKGSRGMQPKHIAFLRHWHEGLRQGKWDHMGASAAAESHGVIGKPGFAGRQPSQIIGAVRHLMAADPHLRRLHQEIPGARAKPQLDWVNVSNDLFEWACSYVADMVTRPLFEGVKKAARKWEQSHKRLERLSGKGFKEYARKVAKWERQRPDETSAEHGERLRQQAGAVDQSIYDRVFAKHRSRVDAAAAEEERRRTKLAQAEEKKRKKALKKAPVPTLTPLAPAKARTVVAMRSIAPQVARATLRPKKMFSLGVK